LEHGTCLGSNKQYLHEISGALDKPLQKWKKNKCRKDAIQDVNAQPIISAVEHVAVSLSVRYTNVERETVQEDRDVTRVNVTARQDSEVATQ
jgi:hypothetical protein